VESGVEQGIRQSFATCVPTIAESQGDFSGYGPRECLDQCGPRFRHHYRQRRRKQDESWAIPVQFQALEPQKVASPDKAGLLIAQFYSDPTTGNNGKTLTTEVTGFSHQQPSELE